MKNRGVSVLILVTLGFLLFTAGFFLGRSYHRAVPQIQVASPAPVTAAETMPKPTNGTGQAETILSAAAPEPSQAEPTGSTAEPAPQQTGGMININTATVQELTQLPGIGPALAQRIVDYRTAHGPFSSVSELKNVYGIGDKKVAALLDYATVGG